MEASSDNWSGDRKSTTAGCTALMTWHNQLVTTCSQVITRNRLRVNVHIDMSGDWRHHKHGGLHRLPVAIAALSNSQHLHANTANIFIARNHMKIKNSWNSRQTEDIWLWHKIRYSIVRNSHVRINHCAGCTIGGPTARGPRLTARFLPRCFDVWTYVQKPQVLWLKHKDN